MMKLVYKQSQPKLVKQLRQLMIKLIGKPIQKIMNLPLNLINKESKN